MNAAAPVLTLNLTPEVSAEFAARLLAAVHRVTGFALEALREQGRTIGHARARTAAMWLLVEVAQMSYAAVGRLLERDHTTVMHAHRNALSCRARAVIEVVFADERGAS